MSGKYFGTDGIRGEYGKGCITPGFARRLGCALGAYLKGVRPNKHHHVVIGHDTRASGTSLKEALCQGLTSEGVLVYDLRTLPTPAIAMAVRDLEADLGVAITASHNPAADNGIKLFSPEATKLDDSTEARIESLVDQTPERPKVPGARFFDDYDGAGQYVNYLRSLLHQGCLGDWKIVLDTANGAAWKTSPAVLGRLGAKLVLIGDTPNGHNINDACGSESPEAMRQRVVAEKAHVGFAHDGDGDRLVVCDEQGNLVDGDALLAILAIHLKVNKRLPGDTIVATVASNLGLDLSLKAHGIKVIRADVGDRYVLEAMRAGGYEFGGESSGHIIFGDHSTTGDGLLAALEVVKLLMQSHKHLSDLIQVYKPLPQAKANIALTAKPALDSVTGFLSAVEAIETSLGPDGRTLVRYSGTEAKIRLLVEAATAEKAASALEQLQKLVSATLPVR